jgi:DNA-binding NarL/FixJ family response regulator
MIRVLLVDDHAVVRHGLKQLLATEPEIEVVGMAADGHEALDLVRRHRPDVVLMDLAMPGLDGIAATRSILGENPDVKVVVLTSFGDEARIIDALDAGAQGYLLKHTEPDALIEAVRSAHAGFAPLDPRAGRVLLDQQRRRQVRSEISQREREVLGLVTRGMANKQIARRLGISERTVKAHLTNVFQRIGVTDRTQAALWARENLPGVDPLRPDPG